jgi:catechol 2,3-dioxygenase-like lactoylglutathione lyase family enzyme
MVLAKQIFANTLFVKDVEISKEFYFKVFGLQPVYEDENSVVFKFGETLINLLQQDQAPGLIGPVPVSSKENGSRFQLTLQVSDVDAECSRLQTLEIPLINGPMDRPWGVRTALFADPDGHLWELAQ